MPFCLIPSHSNRDVVLTHVKGHYHEAGLLLNMKPLGQSTEKPPEPPIIPPTALLRLPILHPVTLTISNSLASIPPQQVATDMTMNPTVASPQPLKSMTPTITMKPVSMLMASPPQPPPLSMVATNHSPNLATSSSASMSPPQLMLVGKQYHHHQLQQQSQNASALENGEMDEASSLGSSVTGWRDPAPYRCGHCHQVSNWKHVIQV